jgi:hypothetical protein
MRLQNASLRFKEPSVPTFEREFHLYLMPLALVSMLFAKLHRQRLKQAERNVHGLKIFRLDV